MDPRLKFVIFALVGVASLALGYAARKRAWVHEQFSERLHWHTVVWVWSAASLFALWKHPLTGTDLWLVPMQAVILCTSAVVVLALAKFCHCTRDQAGVLAIGASVGNTGFTLGGYLCYCRLNPGDRAMTLAMFYVSIMQVVGVLVLYPLAHRFGRNEQSDRPLWRLIVGNFIDARSLLFYATVAGALLAQARVPVPGWVDRWYVLDVVFYLGSIGGYLGIGMRLHLGRALADMKCHLLLAGMKFAFIPLLTLALIGLIRLTGAPLTPLARQMAVLEAFMPAALWTVMLANLFHLDARLAGSVWLWNTVAFLALVLPVILLVV